MFSVPIRVVFTGNGTENEGGASPAPTLTPMAQNVVHFAIHADDVERARRFYENVFGWRFEAWGPPGFYNVITGDDDHPGIHGALHGRNEPLTGNGTRGFTCTVAVKDLAPIRQQVTANGGTIISEEFAIPGVGTLTQFLDTEGNELAAMVYEQDMFGA
jgi:predicted enzyme related to lactoylglutathione lyase